MATAAINIAEASKQSNGHSEMDSSLLTDNTTAQSQTENSTKNDNSLCLESTSDNQENKENDFAYEDSKNRIKRKTNTIFDSDSEKEDDFISSLLDKDHSNESSGTLESETKKLDTANLRGGSRRAIDSESDEEDSIIATKSVNYDNEDIPNENERKMGKKKKTKPRFRTLVDSESEDDNDSNPTENSQEETNEKANLDESTTIKVNKKQKVNSIVDSTSSDEEDSEDARALPMKKKQESSDRDKKAKSDKKTVKSKISSLIDTDSEDDGKRNSVDQPMRDEHHKSGNLAKKTEKSSKKRTGSIRASKDEAMRQIHSETQRLIRSTEVSLPYHRPKQRSLQEFLNRKQFIPALPEGLSTAAKVKMCSEIVGKVLEEKEREAELFYKSSDSEDEVAISTTPANPQDDNEGSSSSALVDHSHIEDTQRILKNDVQNAHNKKEIIQQGAVDLGLPRKLFSKETDDLTVNESTEVEHNNEELSEIEDPRKKTKETKHGLKEVSVPRKLFGNNYEEAVASSNRHDAIDAVSQLHEIAEENSETVDSPIRENGCQSFVDDNRTDIDPKLQDVPSSKHTITEEKAKFTNISDTPFISNKEFARLNEIAKASKEPVVSGEQSDEVENSKEPYVPIGHVFGLPPPDFDNDDRRAEKITNIKKKLQSDVGPRLRGAPGTFIDLSDDVKPNREGVQSLVDRFIRHSATNKTTETCSPVRVVHTEKTDDGLKIVEEILPYKLPSTDNCNDKELNKPGAKYLRLKKELIEKMAKKRGEEWRLKEQQEKDESLDEAEEIEDESEVDAEEHDEHEELQISGESEPEEDDMPAERTKKRKTKSFADEEAEVSGEEDDEEMEISDDNRDDDEEEEEEEEGDKDEKQREVIDENDDDDDDDTCGNLSNAEDEPTNDRKRPSRILKAFEDDSTSSLPEISTESGIEIREKAFERTKTDVDMFAPDDADDGWLSDTETELPPSQLPPRDNVDGRSQLCKTPLTAVDVLRFVSPITQLTAFDSCTDSPKDGISSKGTPGPIRRFLDSSTEKTPLAIQSPISNDSAKRNGFQKKLFDDHVGAVNDEELMDLCSGKFTGVENGDQTVESHGKVAESQLSKLDADSILSQGIRSELFEKDNVPVVDEASQDIRLNLDSDSEDTHDQIIAKESTINSKTPWSNFKVASSSDEENNHEANDRKKKLTKRKIKKLELSDDEEEEALSSQDEEEREILDNDNEDKYVDYDSEENEVVIVPKKDIKKVAAGFLDEEAELSESEWGSADEDEKDLDKLEFEEGDHEEIDENKMRDQLGKIHMRQVLDDDQREVRMLQELLFDDGDLHTEGSGRERQFKWKNIDNLGDDEKLGLPNDDHGDNEDVIEEENDLEWRKQRLERDKFIKEAMKSSDDMANEELDGDSQIFKLGIKALKKSKTIHDSQKDADGALTKKPCVPRTVMDLLGGPENNPSTGQNFKMLSKAVKRGSFLARGDECLARLAVQIKHSETTITTRKNPRNFVFTHISPSVAGTADKKEIDTTITNTDSSTNTKAKKRKPPAGATPQTAKKAKIEVTRSTGKKLF